MMLQYPEQFMRNTCAICCYFKESSKIIRTSQAEILVFPSEENIRIKTIWLNSVRAFKTYYLKFTSIVG